MRLVGPDCFGVAVPGIGLDATFAARPPEPGVAGLVMQSGGLGFALVDHLSRLGIGISSFASVGDKLDVSSNDMLLWWEHDGLTKLAVLYIESFGNPRKFARTARRVSATMPVLTVQAEPHAAASAGPVRAGRGHHHAWLRRAGRGHRAAGHPARPGRAHRGDRVQRRQRRRAGRGRLRRPRPVRPPPARPGQAAAADAHPPGTVTGPVDTTATVSAEAFRQCLELLAADDDVNALLAIVLPTGATGDLEAAIQQATCRAARRRRADAAGVRSAASKSRVPAYGHPEAAVRAWPARPATAPGGPNPAARSRPSPTSGPADARALVRGSRAPGWLGPAQAAELLRCYGIPLADLAPPGPQVKVRVAADRVFGPLVSRSKPATHRRTARFTPLTDVDAAYLIQVPP